jgi:Fe-S-cluster containining protein
MDYGIQDRLIPRFQNYRKNTECPFLLDGKCSVYPLRPLACRIFYVFQIPCGIGEDPIISRPIDVYIQKSEIARHVAMRFFDADPYNLKTIREKEAAFEGGIMFEKTLRMHQLDWTRFIQMIRIFRRLRDK